MFLSATSPSRTEERESIRELLLPARSIESAYFAAGGLVRNGTETTFDPETDVQPDEP